jgi:hypothetical protein
MNFLDLLQRYVWQYENGVITAAELVIKLSDDFAGDRAQQIEDAATVAALIPSEVKSLVLQTIDLILSPTYVRQAFAIGGKTRTKEEENADALRETALARAWAAALKPLLS